MKKSTRGLLEIHIAIFMVGLTGLFGKLITEDAIVIVFGRMSITVLTLLLFSFILKRKLAIANLSTGIKLFYLGVLLAIHWGTFFHSISVSTVAIGLLSFSSFPIFTTILEPIYTKEKYKLVDFIIALIVFVGLVFIIPEWDFQNAKFQGILWGIISGFTYALLAIENKRMVGPVGTSTLVMYQNLFGMLVIIPFLFFVEMDLSSTDIYLLLILGVICTAFAHSLFVHGLKFISARTASLVTAMEPVYGILLAFFILSEIPTLRSVLGGVIIVSGIIINSKFSSEIEKPVNEFI